MEEHDSQIDDFIGWKSKDGKLEVIGIEGRDKHGARLYKVTCTECSKDKELFPNEYFVSTKGSLIKGKKPCGCGRHPRWRDWQYLIRARRIGEKKGFIVHGFAEDFKGFNTKLNLECLKDGHRWVASIHSVINTSNGCHECAIESIKIPENLALQKCVDICKKEGYDPLGFSEGYKNTKSRFEYVCPKHGKHIVTYNIFVYKGSRCPSCAKETVGFYGYYPNRTTEQDYLYVLNFNNKFVKVGRSFDVKRRIAELKQESKIKNIKKLYILTGTHQEIYDLEQELHNELRERGFSYNVDWSTECFDNNSLDFIKYFIQKSGLKTVG